MKYLIKQSQSPQRLDLLLQLCKIKSEGIKTALADYLVKGTNITAAAALNNVEAGNVTRALKRLEQQAFIVEQIKIIDLPKK